MVLGQIHCPCAIRPARFVRGSGGWLFELWTYRLRRFGQTSLILAIIRILLCHALPCFIHFSLLLIRSCFRVFSTSKIVFFSYWFLSTFVGPTHDATRTRLLGVPRRLTDAHVKSADPAIDRQHHDCRFVPLSHFGHHFSKQFQS